jgi:hypothetical protein
MQQVSFGSLADIEVRNIAGAVRREPHWASVPKELANPKAPQRDPK